jgi:malate dehydrogenase
VVGNPANTNCLIALKFAPKLSAKNFSAMTRLDHNRSIGELARKLETTAEHIRKVTVWGNHSNTQVPDASQAVFDGPSGEERIADSLTEAYIHGEFVETIATRGGAVIKARGLSSAASAAQAAIDAMRDWALGTPGGTWVSMAIPVPDDAPYGIKPGVVFSFPVQVDEFGNVEVVRGIEISPWLRDKLKATEDELIAERETAFQVLGAKEKESKSKCCLLV